MGTRTNKVAIECATDEDKRKVNVVQVKTVSNIASLIHWGFKSVVEIGIESEYFMSKTEQDKHQEFIEYQETAN